MSDLAPSRVQDPGKEERMVFMKKLLREVAAAALLLAARELAKSVRRK